MFLNIFSFVIYKNKSVLKIEPVYKNGHSNATYETSFLFYLNHVFILRKLYKPKK